MTTNSSVTNVMVQPLGGSTAIIAIGGLRIVVDPTFDPPGESEPGHPARMTGSALNIEQIGKMDVALVSHDQHPDNLDASGRALLTRTPVVLTTTPGAGRLGHDARGLDPWDRVELERPDGGTLRVTAVPAQHGPVGAEEQSGVVVGFVLEADDCPTVYVSGDNASIDVVQDIADRVTHVDIAVLFVGAAAVPALWNGAPLTLTSDEAAVAARILGARAVVPVHCEGWTHYTQGSAAVAEAFAAAGLTSVLSVVAPGATVTL